MGHRKRKDRSVSQPTGWVEAYEGPEVLTALLAAAGSRLNAPEVAERFARAQRNGEERSAVIPALFLDEPRFGTPAEARRLYSNLFGLWDRVAAGRGPMDDAPEVVMREPPPLPLLPPRGSLPGAQLTADLVEAIWRQLAAMPEREVRRLRDRFEGAQPNLVAWLDQVPLPEEGVIATNDLMFEAWAAFDQAFGERLDAVSWGELVALESEPPPLESTQPTFARYAAEQLDNLADDDPDFTPESRAQVERALASGVAALTRVVEQEA